MVIIPLMLKLDQASTSTM